jgi:hypothetical protein
MQASHGGPGVRMNYEIAPAGDANGLAAQRHFPSNPAEKSDNPLAFILIDKGRGCAVNPRTVDVKLPEISVN